MQEKCAEICILKSNMYFEGTDIASNPTSKILSHKCANSMYFATKHHLCKHNGLFCQKTCIFDFFVVSLHRFLKRRYKDLRNDEGEMDKYRG